MNSRTKPVVFCAVLLVVAGLIWAFLQNGPNSAPTTTYSRLLDQIQAGQVGNATILAAQSGANEVTYTLKDGTHARSIVPADYRDILETMQQKMVNVEIRGANSNWLRFFANAAPFLLLLGFWFFMMSRLSENGPKSGFPPGPGGSTTLPG